MRYLTEGLPGTGGVVRWQPEDFLVEEIPLYEPSGEGEHTYALVEKVGLSTFRAVQMLAGALGIPAQRIGYAGMKDAHARTRQTFSFERVPPERILALDLPGLRVLRVARHRNKLKLGHLRGNRFQVRIREVPREALPRCQAILEVLQSRGMPNYFGAQRFGLREDSHLLGRYLVLRDGEGFLKQFLGAPHPAESEAVQEARQRYEEGQWDQALRLFPGSMQDERKALEALLRSGGSHRHACRAVPKRLRRFFVSAYQSYLFNAILERRLEALDRLEEGDIAMKHENGACFLVQDAVQEQPRADRLEISPTGPLFGYKVRLAEGKPGDLEREVLAGEGLRLEDWRIGEGLAPRGERRALRVPVEDVDLLWDEGIVLRFALPPGSYATVLLGEVMKCPLR
ncbi:MAG: tRNA pseudouridine(13) synthase TruD [Anaerolineae bacterium]|nr:tRNA pseudouridine(13) synthase TruD [Anaerolineae bacterium]